MNSNSAARLRELLARPSMLVMPGAADALSARLIETAGFEAVYATGAGIANTLLGVPDLGLVTMTEMLDQVRRMVEAVQVPIISDVDTGYGNPLNVIRTVRAFESAGVAAIHLEDQVFPKRCGHFVGKEVIPTEEMVAKLKAALDARTDPNFLIIARTDSLAVYGIEEAIHRAQIYAETGADLIFVDAPTTREQVARLPREITAPLLFNMTEGAKTPMFSHAELATLGYKIVIHPNLVMRVAAKAVQTALATLRQAGSSEPLLNDMLTWEERQRLVRLDDYTALDHKYGTATTEGS